MNARIPGLVAAIVFASFRVVAQPPENAVIEPPPASAPDAPDATEESRRVRRWEAPVHPARRNAILYYPISALGRGATLGYERAMPDPRFAIVVRGSVACPGGRDFRSVDLETSLELRFYAFARGPFSRWTSRAPVGVYAGFRFGLVHSRLIDRRDERLVGTLNRLVSEVSVGYRFTIAGRIEISPFLGALFYADLVANLPPSLRPNLSVGTTIGVLF